MDFGRRVKNLGSKRKKADKAKWKRTIETEERYKPVANPPKKLNCIHTGVNQFMCHNVTKEEIAKLHKNFYLKHSKQHQTAIILNNIEVTEPKRHRPGLNTTEDNSVDRKVSIKYFVPGTHARKRICANAFAAILGTNTRRIQRIAQRKKIVGFVEFKSGGNRLSNLYQEKREAVRSFIENLKGCESHYNRANSKRVYLPSHLSVQKLCRYYNQQAPDDLQVKIGFFFSIFNKDYNLSFKSPATDACSTCQCFESRLKNNMNRFRRQEIKRQYRVHKKRAQKFYRRLKRPQPGHFTITADCGKGQPLPKVPDGAAYYKRQLTFNHLAVVEGSSKSKLDKSTVTSYTWTEDQAKKGSNEIASCLFKTLLKAAEDGKLDEFIRVVAGMDNTNSTNKCSGMIAMLIYWLHNHAPPNIEKVL